MKTRSGVRWDRSPGLPTPGGAIADDFKRHVRLKADARRMIANISQQLVKDPARIAEVEQMLNEVQTSDTMRRA